jgi:hypothetical protein
MQMARSPVPSTSAKVRRSSAFTGILLLPTCQTHQDGFGHRRHLAPVSTGKENHMEEVLLVQLTGPANVTGVVEAATEVSNDLVAILTAADDAVLTILGCTFNVKVNHQFPLRSLSASTMGC